MSVSGAPSGPYPGLVPFQDNSVDRSLFYGRDREADDLYGLVVTKPLSVLYGRSGVGKSSLINARVIEKLRRNHMFPVTVRLSQPPATVMSGIISSFIAEAASQGVKLRQVRQCGDTLWEFFAFTQFLSDDGELRPVLIVDQFEELFSVIRVQDPKRERDFVTQFADLVRGRIPERVRRDLEASLKLQNDEPEQRAFLVTLLYEHSAPAVNVLLSLREDYLPELESLRSEIPTVFHSTFRLIPLSRENARLAIEKPPQRKDILGENGSFAFSGGVVDDILEFLSRQRTYDGKITFGPIEPAHLQIVCAELDRRRRVRQQVTITSRDLNKHKGMRRILKRHYRMALRAFHRLRILAVKGGRRRLFVRPRAAVRRLCEIGLITRGGRQRNTLMRDAILEQFDVTEDDLEKLVNLRILRVDWRVDAPFFELSHDVLVEPVGSWHRWYQLRRIGAAVLFVLSLLAAVPAWRIWQQSFGYRRSLSMLKSSAARSDRLRDIAYPSDAQKSDLAGVDLRELQGSQMRLSNILLDGAHLDSAVLDEARIASVSFSAAFLQRASFKRATIDDVRFDHCDLREASFAVANLRDTTFEGAKLRDSSFASAWLQGVSFAGADLRGSQFTETHLDGHTSFIGSKISESSFDGTPWWLAKGWSEEQFESLRDQYRSEALIDSTVFRSEIQSLNSLVVDARVTRSPAKVAAARQKRAAFRAMLGLDLGNALKDIEAAVHSSPPNATFYDTRAYILMQCSQCRDAMVDLNKAVSTDKDLRRGPMTSLSASAARRATIIGPIAYHYALACEYAGLGDSAKRWFEFATLLGYVPTYERLLTPRDPTLAIGCLGLIARDCSQLPDEVTNSYPDSRR
jgi:uncharacterized protein YjbI with pentapeptide repeats